MANDDSSTQRYALGFVPALDGLRGLFCLAVIAHHLNPRWMTGAGVFMDTFFLMSAWFITRLLRRDLEREGQIDFRRFYVRRFLRLCPALWLLLAVYLAVCLSTLPAPARHVSAALAAGLYLSNWTRAFEFPTGTWLDHTWSLSVEEQFYLAWPLCFFFVSRMEGARRQFAILLALAAAVALWRINLAWSALEPGGDIDRTIIRIYNGTDTRADAFLLGAALALVPLESDRTATLRRWLHRLALPAFLILATAGVVLHGRMLGVYLGGNLVTTGLSLLVVAALAAPGSHLLRRLLDLPLLTYVGSRCYALYLWHFPVFTYLRLGLGMHDIAWVALIGLSVTAIAAEVSWRLVERPAFDWKQRHASYRPAVSALR